MSKKKDNDPEIIIDKEGIPMIVMSGEENTNSLERWLSFYDLQDQKTTINMPDILEELTKSFKKPEAKIRKITDISTVSPLIRLFDNVFKQHGFKFNLYEVKLKEKEKEEEKKEGDDNN